MPTVCTACGAQVETPFCGRCGTPAGADSPPPPPPPVAAPSPVWQAAPPPPGQAPPAWQPAPPAGSPYLLPPQGSAPWQPQPGPSAQPYGSAPLLPPTGHPAGHHARRRNAQIIGWAAALVIAVGAAWVAVEGFDTGGDKRTLEGTFTLYDEAFLDIDDDEDCTGEDAGIDELDPASDVVVMDGNGDVLDRTSLGVGVVDGAGCVFTFRARVEEASRYRVEAAVGNGVSYTDDELADADWEVELSLGDEDL